jgi:serine/threonine protein kinase
MTRPRHAWYIPKTTFKIELKRSGYLTVEMSSDDLVIFINKDAIKIDEIFLNDEWHLSKFFDNVYTISIVDQKLNWLVKTYPKIRHAKKESDSLNKLHKIEGVPKILATGLSEKFSYVILSRAPGMDLYEYTEKYGSFSEKTVRHIVKQLLNISLAFHRKKIIHKDIKPENIIYDKTTKKIVLIDFEGKSTNDYHSPEQVRQTALTHKTDIWSIGITVFYLTHGDVPFNGKNKILQSEPHFSKKCSDEFKDFMSCLLEKDCNLRYSAKEALNDPWISE